MINQTTNQTTNRTDETNAADTADIHVAGLARHGLRPVATALAAAALLAAVGAGADAYESAAKPKPVANVGPRAAALLVPSYNDKELLMAKLERNTGFERVYQPARGIYCFVPKKKLKLKLKNPVVVLTPDWSGSVGGSRGTVGWLSNAAHYGCKANEIGAATVLPDPVGGGGHSATNSVAFAIVVD